jgi:hypothetical protein
MTNTEDEISSLNHKLARLEARLEELGTDYRKVVRALSDYDQLQDKHCNLLETELGDAFERIKHIEFTLFPNLGRDITQLHDIFGDCEDKALNPLDHRKK